MKDVTKIREMYPKGTMIELEEMKGEPQMPCGMKGTVRFVDDIGQIHVQWENGSSLALSIEDDTFNKIEPQPKKLSVLLVEPNKYPKMVEIEDTLEEMQKIVGGNIEVYMPFTDAVSIVCNEEGKYDHSLPNRAVYTDNGKMVDIIHGTFFVCYTPIESENFLSLPEDMVKKYKEKFKYPEKIFKGNDGYTVIKASKESRDYER